MFGDDLDVSKIGPDDVNSIVEYAKYFKVTLPDSFLKVIAEVNYEDAASKDAFAFELIKWMVTESSLKDEPLWNESIKKAQALLDKRNALIAGQNV